MQMHCHNRHLLAAGLSKPDAENRVFHCDICLKDITDSCSRVGAISCGVCDIDVCPVCLRFAGNKIDTGILIRLQRMPALGNNPKSLLHVYRESPHYASELFRNPDAARIYWEVQKFYLSDMYKCFLEREYESALDALSVAQTRVSTSHNNILKLNYERGELNATDQLEQVCDVAKKRKFPDEGLVQREDSHCLPNTDVIQNTM